MTSLIIILYQFSLYNIISGKNVTSQAKWDKLSHNKDMFAKKLKELRSEKGWKQEDLAKMLNVDRTTVVKWERGERETSFAMLVCIAELFEVSVDYLLGRED